MRVAAGAIARKYLRERAGMAIHGYVAQLGPIALEAKNMAIVDDNPFFCADPDKIGELEAFMDALNKSGDSIGARINVVASGVMPGLGEPVFDKLEAEGIGFLTWPGRDDLARFVFGHTTTLEDTNALIDALQAIA